MANKNTVLMITNKETDLSGVITPIDENNLTIVWDNEITENYTTADLDALMESNEYEIEEVELEEDTAAQDSIKAHASADVAPGQEADGNPKTRIDMIRAILGGLANVDMQSLVKLFNDQQALVGGEGARAGLEGKAAGNQASIKMKPSAAMESVIPALQKEEQDAIFAETSLTEEAKSKMTNLFEAAVIARVTEEVVKLQSDYEVRLEENTSTITESLIESIDTYMTHVAEEWLKENEVAIESALRNELVGEFIDKLQGLFTEHYIDVPEEKVNVIEKLVGENEELQNKINDMINENIETQKTIKSLKKNEIISNFSEGLTIPNKDRLKKLVEGLDFEDEESFKNKVKDIKEGFLKEKNTDSNVVTEGIKEETPKKTNDSYVDAISRSLSNFK